MKTLLRNLLELPARNRKELDSGEVAVSEISAKAGSTLLQKTIEVLYSFCNAFV